MKIRILLLSSFLLVILYTAAVIAQQDNEPVSETLKKGEAELELNVSASEYWNLQYHPQVTRELFMLIDYPYFPGGRVFDREGSISVRGVNYDEFVSDTDRVDFQSEILKDISELRQLIQEQEADKKEKESNKDELESQQVLLSTENNLVDNVSPDADNDLAIDGAENYQVGDIHAARNYLEKCSDLIFKWRRVNESPLFIVEVLRSVELTKTESGVYDTSPEVAVQIKRVLGNIAKINRNFDFTCRVMMESILVDEYPRSWLSRLEKQLADLQIRAMMLEELNDKGCESLGLGKIDRSYDKIQYQKVEFIRIKEPDKYER